MHAFKLQTRTMASQIRELAHAYKRHGGKDNRRQQLGRLATACEWIAFNHQISNLHEIGKRQVIDFYRNHRHLADSTLAGYFYAFVTLWAWLGRTGEPPRPGNRIE
ncbi:MAG: hypothetical protein KGI54_11220 [Pseudomonadota bacterium]|nr:hypothetical protein [Pseudomonadota bacterium]